LSVSAPVLQIEFVFVDDYLHVLPLISFEDDVVLNGGKHFDSAVALLDQRDGRLAHGLLKHDRKVAALVDLLEGEHCVEELSFGLELHALDTIVHTDNLVRVQQFHHES